MVVWLEIPELKTVNRGSLGLCLSQPTSHGELRANERPNLKNKLEGISKVDRGGCYPACSGLNTHVQAHPLSHMYIQM